jgi:N-acetylglucosamine-6-phosphate deacetylase
MEKLLVTGGTVITPFEEMANREILAIDGIIERISPAGTIKDFDTKIDAGGKLVVPGFIEIHVQGAGGAYPVPALASG